ncbi:hypothetical protein APV28_0287 [Comamonas testosteroni]|nr:hypothetical protein APV28_0287 [Comamonas testosteroni]
MGQWGVHGKGLHREGAQHMKNRCRRWMHCRTGRRQASCKNALAANSLMHENCIKNRFHAI